LKIKIRKLSCEDLGKKEADDYKEICQTLISYGKEEPDLKIDISSKLYLHVGGCIYFYKQKEDDESKISIQKIDLT